MKKTSSPTSCTSSAKVLLPRAQYLTQPSTVVFDTEEHQYFSLFSEKIAVELLPYFTPTPWRCIISQAYVSEPSIRHAAIGIGALCKTFKVAQSGRGRRLDVIHHRAPVLWLRLKRLRGSKAGLPEQYRFKKLFCAINTLLGSTIKPSSKCKILHRGTIFAQH
jgi:hypothetical protein